MKQLRKLAEKFDERLIKTKQGFSYVPHSEVNQYILAAVGPHDFHIVEILYNSENQIEGCTAIMTLDIDGKCRSVTEVGDCEFPKNWKTNGARLKDAASDAYKRCAMRFGCGLHLWAQEKYFLDKALDKQE